ncbi:MAG: bifunctional phosphoserine phosphatase/homoserine phosphotransferase ThrH [Desulfobacterales bacterium]|nr:bifunctional phosphoserine phosphatase/homoserine phosphotransferase ThrH [Desulfobacterales bacterium]
MYIVCSDLEGILFPEIWINVAEKTGIEELRLTTRDTSDYDVLMKKRLAILHENGLKIQDIKEVIATISPIDGALEFLNWLRENVQVVIVSDTFVQFAGPLMKQLGWPTIFCHSLSIGPGGMITGYNLRQADGKRRVVLALKGLNYQTIAVGDSYNDIHMLQEAEKGILYNPPPQVVNDYPEFSVTRSYDELKALIGETLTLLP